MPKMSVPGAQVKIWLPMQLYQVLDRDAEQTGRPKAEVVRAMIAEYYGRNGGQVKQVEVEDAGAVAEEVAA